MTLLGLILMLLFMGCLVALAAGLLKPSMVQLGSGEPSRSTVATQYGLIAAALFVLVIIFAA